MVVPAAGRQSAKVGLPASGRHYQNPLFEPHRRAVALPALAGNRRVAGEGAGRDRWRHGWRHRAPKDGFTACPGQPGRIKATNAHAFQSRPLTSTNVEVR